MITTQRMRSAGAILLAGGLAVLGITLGPTAVNTISGAAAQAQTQAQAQACATQSTTHFYALDPGKVTLASFGVNLYDPSTQNADSATLQAHYLPILQETVKNDPAALAAYWATYTQVNGGAIATPAAMASDQQHMLQDRSYWCGRTTLFDSDNVKSVKMVDVPAGSESMCMTSSDGKTVVVTKCHTAAAGHGLLITFKDGTTLELRLECHFQPIVPPGTFGHIPECTSDSPECAPPACTTCSCLGNCHVPTCEELGLPCSKNPADGAGAKGKAPTGAGKPTGPVATPTPTPAPTTPYTPPAAPAPSPTSTSSPEPVPTKDPEPAPTIEPSAQPTPVGGTSCAPGVPSC